MISRVIEFGALFLNEAGLFSNVTFCEVSWFLESKYFLITNLKYLSDAQAVKGTNSLWKSKLVFEDLLSEDLLINDLLIFTDS